MFKNFINSLIFRYNITLAITMVVITLFGMTMFYLQAYHALETESKSVIKEMLYYHKNNPNSVILQNISDDAHFRSGALTFQLLDNSDITDLGASLSDNVVNYKNDKYENKIFTKDKLNYLYINHFVGLTKVWGNKWLVVSKNNDISNLLIYFNNILIYLLISMFVIMMLFAYLMTNRIFKRINYIDRAAKVIMQGNMERRIVVSNDHNDEINQLSITLNEMLDKISILMKHTIQSNHNIAHDLKSPLNRLKNRLEVSLLNTRTPTDYQNVIDKSISDLDSLIQTFNSMLLIANLDSGARNYNLEKMNLSNLLIDLSDMYEILAEETGHEISTYIEPDLLVKGNKDLLAQAFSNLIENSIKYTPPNSKIEIKTNVYNHWIEIFFIDNGNGIAVENHEKVFEQFFRLDESRSLPGTGLGLNLVKSILVIHNAKIRLEENKPKGLVVCVTIPRVNL